MKSGLEGLLEGEGIEWVIDAMGFEDLEGCGCVGLRIS